MSALAITKLLKAEAGWKVVKFQIKLKFIFWQIQAQAKIQGENVRMESQGKNTIPRKIWFTLARVMRTHPNAMATHKNPTQQVSKARQLCRWGCFCERHSYKTRSSAVPPCVSNPLYKAGNIVEAPMVKPPPLSSPTLSSPPAVASVTPKRILPHTQRLSYPAASLSALPKRHHTLDAHSATAQDVTLCTLLAFSGTSSGLYWGWKANQETARSLLTPKREKLCAFKQKTMP